jgi:parallel beta-helix repeat protein
MKNTPAKLFCFTFVLCFTPGVLLAQGSLTPPGAPAPIMKTLDQVQPRTPLSSQSLINNPGSYYLTTNVLCNGGGYGFIIQTDNVSIDFNGFSLIGITNSNAGILVNGPHTNLTVCNGTVRNWGGVGIDASQCSGNRFENLTILNNNGDGLDCGDSSLINHCTASLNTGTGFSAGPNSTFISCIATANTNGGVGDGFVGAAQCQFIGCKASFNSGVGFFPTSNGGLKDCIAAQNGQQGIYAGVFSGFTIKDCTAAGNALDGISVGTGVTVSGCTSTGNGHLGIGAGTGCMITGCTTVSNASAGISATTGCTISGCTAQGNTADGIIVSSRCVVRDNTCDGNGNGGTLAGIHASGSNNRIDGNQVSNNNSRGIKVDAATNLIIRNSAHGNITGNYDIAASNSIAEALGGGFNFTSTDPWANFSY